MRRRHTVSIASEQRLKAHSRTGRQTSKQANVLTNGQKEDGHFIFLSYIIIIVDRYTRRIQAHSHTMVAEVAMTF